MQHQHGGMAVPAFVAALRGLWQSSGRGGVPNYGVQYLADVVGNVEEQRVKAACREFLISEQFGSLTDNMFLEWKLQLDYTGPFDDSEDVFNALQEPEDHKSSMAMDNLLNNDLDNTAPFKEAFTSGVNRVQLYSLGDEEAIFGVVLVGVRKERGAVLLYYLID